jgi:DNA processing protein
MGAGFDCPYPAENQDLFDKIAENGAIMTEFHLDMGPRGENFPTRNRLIAGLAAAVVVVEAAERSLRPVYWQSPSPGWMTRALPADSEP